METLIPRALIKSWTTTPIPNLKLSAGGLLALADLHTVARRTALNGGSSWLDALVLAPGLHYQQACEILDQDDNTPGWIPDLTAVEGDVRHAVKNVLTLKYLKRLYRDGSVGEVVVDVGKVRVGRAKRVLRRWERQMRALKEQILDDNDDDDEDGIPDVDWVSHLLYIASPLLTIVAITFMILLEDWWGLTFIAALMLARTLNIWAIKHRTEPPPQPLTRRRAVYTIDLGHDRTIHLRGRDCDLQALTTQGWLRAQSDVDSYLEACAKLIVYLVAALSGNLSQAGAMVLAVLLLVSVALLGLSNAHAKGFRMHGRYALQAKTSGEIYIGSTTALESVAERGENRMRRTPKVIVTSTSAPVGQGSRDGVEG